ncbi:MAG: response regulator transcription factor [Gammaproteobacteria bacterium]|nr:response regulator transcription factor [Gammaproteobacteria bacterium]
MKWVLIADDHPVVRQGVERILAMDRSLRVVGHAGDGWEVLDKLRELPADVLLLDLWMPGPHGAELVRRVKKAHPSVAVLVFSAAADSLIAARAIRSGAAGFITKDSNPGDLIVALKRVAEGGRYVHPSVAEAMVFDSGGGGDELPHHRLSDREMQIFLEMVQGKSSKDIAAALQITVKTVSTHKMRLMRKLGVGSTAGLMRYAFTHGIAC